MKNPIVNEVRAAREAYAKGHRYDLAAICADLRQRQARSGRKVVNLARAKRPLETAKV